MALHGQTQRPCVAQVVHGWDAHDCCGRRTWPVQTREVAWICPVQPDGDGGGDTTNPAQTHGCHLPNGHPHVCPCAGCPAQTSTVVRCIHRPAQASRPFLRGAATLSCTGQIFRPSLSGLPRVFPNTDLYRARISFGFAQGKKTTVEPPRDVWTWPCAGPPGAKTAHGWKCAGLCRVPSASALSPTSDPDSLPTFPLDSRENACWTSDGRNFPTFLTDQVTIVVSRFTVAAPESRCQIRRLTPCFAPLFSLRFLRE